MLDNLNNDFQMKLIIFETNVEGICLNVPNDAFQQVHMVYA